MSKKSYTPITIAHTRMTLTCNVLSGSVTTTPIKVGDVAVENFEQGFSESGADFANISFD